MGLFGPMLGQHLGAFLGLGQHLTGLYGLWLGRHLAHQSWAFVGLDWANIWPTKHGPLWAWAKLLPCILFKEFNNQFNKSPIIYLNNFSIK
jgi:hypothetical protein